MDIWECSFLQRIAGTRIWIYGTSILATFTCGFIRHIFLQPDFREIKFFKEVDIRHTNTGYLLADLFTSLATLVHLDKSREEKGSLSKVRLQHGPPMNSVFTGISVPMVTLDERTNQIPAVPLLATQTTPVVSSVDHRHPVFSIIQTVILTSIGAASTEHFES
jgi:hypothetical protein